VVDEEVVARVGGTGVAGVGVLAEAKVPVQEVECWE